MSAKRAETRERGAPKGLGRQGGVRVPLGSELACESAAAGAVSDFTLRLVLIARWERLRARAGRGARFEACGILTSRR